MWVILVYLYNDELFCFAHINWILKKKFWFYLGKPTKTNYLIKNLSNLNKFKITSVILIGCANFRGFCLSASLCRTSLCLCNVSFEIIFDFPRVVSVT